MECILTFEDFKRVFDFSVSYHLSNKPLSDRTNGNPRSLGAIMDAFSRGKLIEIGIEKIFYNLNSNKKYILDFDIHDANNEPDIIKIIENNIERSVKNFIEIKSIANNDEWIGLRTEQFESIELYAKSQNISLSNIYLIYASLNTQQQTRQNDITGMFLKEIENTNKSVIFQKYADLNANIKIEFIVSFQELKKYGRIFTKETECIYDTNIFIEKKISEFYKNNDLKDKYSFVNNNQRTHLTLYINDNHTDRTVNDLCIFDILNNIENVDYKIIKKQNDKSIKYFIETKSDLKIFNNIFGYYNLNANKIYSLNIDTKGRNPILKNNNIFISRKRVLELIQENKIINTNIKIKEIVEMI